MGDVLTADDPEPPAGTVVRDEDGDEAKREADGGWVWITAEVPSRAWRPTWKAVAREASGSLTVVKGR